MPRALAYLRDLEFAYANVRLDSFLYNTEGNIVLCGFTRSRPFGQDDPFASMPLEKLGVKGPPLTVSDTTDRFALAPVMFEVESDAEPGNLILVHNSLGFPPVTTGNESLYSIIVKAWRVGYLMIIFI